MLTTQNGKFYLDGNEFKLYSGAIHYFRVLPEYWHDRLLKLKAMGLTTVETYVAWNIHEPKEGEFTFDGIADIRKFILTAKELGLYVIVRPGPYICAEWDFGGFPAWLLKYEDVRLRCYEDRYMYYVERYLRKLFEQIADLDYSNGGNIIAMQVENEYGSYGRDKKYLSALKAIYRNAGVKCMLFTSDGEHKSNLSGGRVEDELMVANFGSNPKRKFSDLKEMQPDKPLVCGEFWCGWFTTYCGNYNSGSSASQVAGYLKEFIDLDAGFNFYMFHGGTNFGFTAGANCYRHYLPDIASYDYGAPLTEWGDYTDKYRKCREIIFKARGVEPMALPDRPLTCAYPKVELTEEIGFKQALESVSTLHHSNIPYPMEHYGQNQGYILYTTEFSGSYGDSKLTFENVHDVAYVWVDGEYKGRFNRLDVDYYKGGKDEYSVDVKGFDGTIKIEVLVEAMGRVNYGAKIYDRKGLTGVRIGDQYIYGWEVRTIPLDEIDKLAKNESQIKAAYPKFYRGSFEIKGAIRDTFIDMQGFTKGCVFINGFNLGRYWNEGPQRTFYIPAPLLKEQNEIVIFEQERAYTNSVGFQEKPIYGKYLPENGKPKFRFWFKKSK
ncbi:MAG: beta-galactosidase [Clostridia bacterium]|nr:beta-galactosidase [Clostridia bacterium]